MTTANQMNSEPRIRVPKQARGKQTREKIIKAAEALFAEQGFDFTTAQRICELAGVSVGSFYAYFKDKKTLLTELTTSYFGRLTSVWREQVDVAPLRAGDLNEQIRGLVELVMKSQGFRLDLLKVIITTAMRDRQFAKLVGNLNRRGLELFRAMLEQHRELLRVKDLEAAAYVIGSGVVWTGLQMALLPEAGAPDAQRLATALTDMIRRYLLLEETEKSWTTEQLK